MMNAFLGRCGYGRKLCRDHRGSEMLVCTRYCYVVICFSTSGVLYHVLCLTYCIYNILCMQAKCAYMYTVYTSILILAGLTTPGLSSLSTEPLRFPPKLILDESSASVIVIEWGESPTNISQSILYEVDYTLTPFQQPSMDPIREFVSFINIKVMMVKIHLP